LEHCKGRKWEVELEGALLPHIRLKRDATPHMDGLGRFMHDGEHGEIGIPHVWPRGA